MIFPIKKLTFFALNILKKHNQGIVHSVYRKTINFSFNGQLLALQSIHSPLSPISLITELSSEQMENLDISVGDIVIVSRNKLTIIGSTNNYSFSHSQATFFETCFRPDLNYEEIGKLRTSIHKVLSSVNTNGFDIIFNNNINDSSLLPLIAAQKRIENGKTFYIEKKYLEAAEVLSRLIGLGSGLTPSGDDFLCGLLAGIQILKMQNHPFTNHLKTFIKEHLQDTVDVSAAFLACALQNQFSLAVNSLSQIPSFEDMRKNFLSIGHSSGIDTLCGVCFALDIF